MILTGAPGAGKTAILRALEARGHAVVEEAATDVIALAHARGVEAPHLDPAFLESILDLQLRRQGAWPDAALVFHDRSPVCTAALAAFLGYPLPDRLSRALTDIARDGTFERRVLFVRTLGWIINTAARTISYEDTLRFEATHERVYRRLGYDLVDIGPGDVDDRAESVVRAALAGAPQARRD